IGTSFNNNFSTIDSYLCFLSHIFPHYNRDGVKMKVLVVGRGGREHAICQKVSESSLVDTVYVAPGNPGMLNCATLVNIDESNHEDLVNFAKAENIGLTIIGP